MLVQDGLGLVGQVQCMQYPTKQNQCSNYLLHVYCFESNQDFGYYLLGVFKGRAAIESSRAQAQQGLSLA